MAGDDGSISRHRRRDGTIGFRVRLHVNGRRISYGVYDTYEEAEDRLAAALEQRGAADGSTTLAGWGIDWLNARERAGHRAIDKDRARWQLHVAKSWIAKLPLRRIARADVVRFARELGEKRAPRSEKPLARQTVVHVLNLVRKALHDAADEGLIGANPAADVRIPRGRGSSEEPWTWLTLDEIARVLELPVCRGSEKHPLERARDGSETKTITPAQLAILTVAVYSGLRAGELWALRWADVHLDERRPELVVRASNDGPTKSGRVRRVPLLAPARLALERWKQLRPAIAAALVFPNHDGGRHAEGYDADWKRVRELAAVKRRVRFHDLRHTCASHLVQGSWGRAWRLEEVGALLGHSSPTVTARYAHLAPGGLHDAARATSATGHQLDTARANVVSIDTRKVPE